MVHAYIGVSREIGLTFLRVLFQLTAKAFHDDDGNLGTGNSVGFRARGVLEVLDPKQLWRAHG